MCKSRVFLQSHFYLQKVTRLSISCSLTLYRERGHSVEKSDLLIAMESQPWIPSSMGFRRPCDVFQRSAENLTHFAGKNRYFFGFQELFCF